MGYVYLLGPDRNVWEKPDLADLIVLKRHKGHSLATRIIGDFLVYWWHKILRRKSQASP